MRYECCQCDREEGVLRVPGIWTLLAEVSERRAMPENISSRGNGLSE